MIFGKIHNFVCIPSTSDNNFSKHFLPLMYKLLLFFPLFAPVQTYVNAFAAKSALSAFPFPGKIHPILPAFFDHTHFLGHCAKTWRFFQFACGYGCPLFFQRAYLPAQYMLYAVKLQGIYTAYSYLSVRATVDLPLPENSIHAILFQLRLLAQRLLFALTSKPQKDIYYISYKGKLSKKLPKRYK